MSDTNERTLELSEAQVAAELNDQIERSRSRVPQPGRQTDDCWECGNTLPDRRADAGYTKCVQCAEREERQHARYVH